MEHGVSGQNKGARRDDEPGAGVIEAAHAAGSGVVPSLPLGTKANSASVTGKDRPVRSYTHDIIRIDDLCIAIDIKGGALEVVRGTSFRIPAGKTVALVGESGSGKSILAQSILGILPKVATITSGSI